jgi:hypothetical protein
MIAPRHLLVLVVLGSLPFFARAAAADPWPRLRGDRTASCQEALALGTQAFRSTSASLLDPSSTQGAAVRSARVMGIDQLDISGGDAIAADPQEFDKLASPADMSPRSVYWQRAATRFRIVVGERSYGWRGDQYTVHVLPRDVASAAFMQAWSRQEQHPTWQPVVGSSWRPPTVFRHPSGHYWLLHPGEPYQFLAPWFVYTVDDRGASEACSIEFRPATKTAVALLPPEIGKLERLLDRTMGSGANEGTLNPTARLRVAVQQTWANVALRPWALGSPYNTSAEVEAALSDWAAASPANARLRLAIDAQARLAERALAGYYMRVFHRGRADAARAAAFAIDVAIREHYTFHSDSPPSAGRAGEGSALWPAPGVR